MIVIDASVLVNVVADDGAAGRTARTALVGQELSAPDLVDVETVTALRRRWRSGELTSARFADAIDDLRALPMDRYPALPLIIRAFELRGNVTAFDAMYVALAEVLECPLITGNGRLARAPGIRCEVRLLTD